MLLDESHQVATGFLFFAFEQDFKVDGQAAGLEPGFCSAQEREKLALSSEAPRARMRFSSTTGSKGDVFQSLRGSTGMTS